MKIRNLFMVTVVIIVGIMITACQTEVKPKKKSKDNKLTAVQIAELIEFAGFEGTDFVTSGFILPASISGADLSWDSTNTDIITVAGGFAIPNTATLETETIVILKATVTPDDGGTSYTVDVPFTVQPPVDTYNEAITKAADRINELLAQDKGIEFAEGEDKNNVKNNFELPSSGPFNTSISWVADPATGEILIGANDNGKYPVTVTPGDVEKAITLRGTISKEDGTTQEVTKVIKVQPLTETEQVEKVVTDFDINEHFIGPGNEDTQESVTRDFALPATGDYDVDITYVSDTPSILTIEPDIVGGAYPVTVTRPTTSDEVVTITATFTNGSISRTLEIPVTVKQKTYTPKETGPAGGKIFYVNPNASTDGWTYLEIAPADAVAGHVTWDSGYFTRNLNMETGTAIGTGRTNTLYIVDKLTSTSPNVTGQAAQKCDEYSVNDYTDWFMPSKDEIQLWTNIFTPAEQSALGIYAKTYWTSSEQTGSEIDRVYLQDITGNESITRSKVDTYYVRAIRRF